MTSPFTPSKTDGAVEILRTIFGPVMDSVIASDSATAASTASNMLGAAFGYFNSGVLFFGSLILIFVTVFGISNSANDGIALGKKWSTFYTPIRALVSVGALVPTASGYAGIQLALLLVVSYSIGFASNMWEAVVAKSIQDELITEATASVTSNPNFDEMVLSALQMQICAAGVNTAMRTMYPDSGVSLQLVDNVTATLPTLNNRIVQHEELYYIDDKFPAARDVCGTLKFQTVVDVSNSNSRVATDMATETRYAILKIRSEFARGFADVNGPVGVMAQKIIVKLANDGGEPIRSADVAREIEQMRVRFQADMVATVKESMVQGSGAAVRQITGKGWVYAASVTDEVARIKDAVRSATVTQAVTYETGSGSLATGVTGASFDAAQQILSKYLVAASVLGKKAGELKTQTRSARPPIPTIKTNYTKEDFLSDGSGTVNKIKALVSSPGSMVVTGVVDIMSNPSKDPLIQIKDVGDYMMGTVESYMIGTAVLESILEGIKAGVSKASEAIYVPAPAAGVVVGLLAGLSALIAKIVAATKISLYTILYAGYVLGIWIPMVPFYVFTLGVVGWLIFVVEMLAAGVLWMAAHTTPAKEDSFIGSQTQGYLLVMSGFFRPALMVLGLVASSALLAPILTFVSESFKLKFMSLQADSYTGIFAVAGYLLVYTIIVSSVIMLIFTLPQTLPDRILKWIGAGIGDMGEQSSGQRVEQAASSTSRKAAMTGQQLQDGRNRAAADQIAKAGESVRQTGRDSVQERLVAAIEGQSGQSSIAPAPPPPPKPTRRV